MNREFIMTWEFNRNWKELGFNYDDDLRRLQNQILDNPKIGKVLKDTGGVRKMRFPFKYQGKSGSVRVCYVDFEVKEKVILLSAFQKSKKSNLTKQERNTLRKAMDILERGI